MSVRILFLIDDDLNKKLIHQYCVTDEKLQDKKEIIKENKSCFEFQ